jgi:hypothetical protein
VGEQALSEHRPKCRSVVGWLVGWLVVAPSPYIL